MTWTCPTCQRKFKHKNQSHSCVQVDPDEHFIGKNPEVQRMYNTLISKIEKFGNINISPARNAILIKASGTFLAVKPKKQWLDIEFLLDEDIDAYPIYKTFRVSKRRVAHFVRLETSKDINTKLLGWLKRSYEVINRV